MKIYKSKTHKYRIIENTMVNCSKNYQVEFKLIWGFPFDFLPTWRTGRKFTSIVDAENYVTDIIKADNKCYGENIVKSSRIL